MKVSSGLCALPLVHLCEQQMGVLLVKREGMKLICALGSTCLCDRPPSKASAALPCLMCTSGGFFGGRVLGCGWGCVSLTWLFSA